MSHKILTVDDSKAVRMIIQRAFLAHDCVFCQAGDGVAGLAAAASESPDLVILDVTMPVMDGITMLGKLREDPGLKHIPVIMLTAESSKDNVANVTQLGINDYLVKPFEDAVLLEKASKILPLQLKAA
jgi:two-component system, cell cycle response regulator